VIFAKFSSPSSERLCIFGLRDATYSQLPLLAQRRQTADKQYSFGQPSSKQLKIHSQLLSNPDNSQKIMPTKSLQSLCRGNDSVARTGMLQVITKKLNQ